MKFYVAGKFADRLDVKAIMVGLLLRGHEITCDWTGHELHDNTEPHDLQQQWAVEDMQGVRKADVLIALFVKPHQYRGAFIEIGAALALGKPVWVLGDTQRSATMMHHPFIDHISWEELERRTARSSDRVP